LLDSDGTADDSLDFDGTEDGVDDGSLEGNSTNSMIYSSFRSIII
jgi:hypothetical protein